MAELTVPQIDFSPIGQLPDIYRKAQDDANVKQTLASLGQGGSDAQALIKSGNLSLAGLGITMQNHQDTLHQQEIANARQATQDALAQKNSDRSYGLQLRTANRADQTPLEAMQERSAAAEAAGLEPGSPEYTAYGLTGKVPDSVMGTDATATATQRAGLARHYGIDPTTPEGKSFILTGKLPDTSPESGFETNPDFGKVDGAPRLRPIPGGPKDPSTIAAEAEAKQGGGMGDGAVEILARRLNSGDTAALQNVGRGAQGSKNLERIQNRAAEILQKEDGLSVSDAAKHVSTNIQSFKASQVGQSAEARTGAVREANLNLILKATEAAIPAALEQSDKVSRTGFVPLNKIIQGGQVMTSDPELKKFAMANLQLAEHWARAMNPTGVMRESDRDKALAILSTADSNPTYHAVVNQLHTQITRERDAVRGSIPESPQFKGGGAQPTAQPPAQATPNDPLGIR